MKENSSTEMGRAQSDSTSLTLACRNGLGDGDRERKDSGVSKERQIMEEYNYCGQDKDNGCNPDTA